MIIYRLAHDSENYRWLECTNGAYASFFHNMWGQSISPKEEIEFRKIRDKATHQIGDFPVAPCQIISDNFKQVIEEYVDGLVEFFPIRIKTKEEQKYYIMNVVNICDCLDKEKSEAKYFSDNIRIMRMIEYAFKPMDEKDSRIFRLKGSEKNVYINEYIKEILEKAGIQGVVFEDTRERCENPFLKFVKKS
jgi:hypothetical protein